VSAVFIIVTNALPELLIRSFYARTICCCLRVLSLVCLAFDFDRCGYNRRADSAVTDVTSVCNENI
jgi:hypothetical protein